MMNRLKIGTESIDRGERRSFRLEVSQSASGFPVYMPITVWRARKPGPTLFVTAAIHGDELNGTGIIRDIILRPPFELRRGSLILIPVVNILGFERHIRYLPDRRDLNRCFPGGRSGSLARRIARTLFDEVVCKCDYGVDLHTAAIRRTNFPNVRADMSNEGTARLARAFGAELIINAGGPKGSLRRTATKHGCPTIILEAGEVWKIEPSVVEHGLRGVQNVLVELEMIEGTLQRPPYQAIAARTTWVRADWGGILEFHVAPGDLVKKNTALATNSNLFGDEQNVIRSPAAGVVLSLTTIPSVTPGDAVCHIAIPRGGLKPIREALANVSSGSLAAQVREDLATNITVSDPPPFGGATPGSDPLAR